MRVLGRKSSLFSPLSLSPALWLKADGVLWQDSARTTPAVADGDPVGAWDDASGNGRNLTQANTGLRPLLKLSIQNGLPVVRFDGADDVLALASQLIGNYGGPSAITVFAVLNQTATKNPSLYEITSGANNNRINCHPQWSNGNVYFDHGPIALGGRISGAMSGLVGAFHEFEVQRNGAPGVVLVDGASKLSANFTSDLDTSQSGTLNVGAATGSGGGAGFDLGELMICAAAVTLAGMRAYLKAKWGTP